MKTGFDWPEARWRELNAKELYYIMTAAKDGKHTRDCTLECFRGLAACFKGSTERGVIAAKSVYGIGEVRDTPYMRQAYEMGRSIK